MRSLIFATLALAVSVGSQSDELAKERKALQGTWQAVRIEASGITGPPEVTERVRWIFSGDEYTGVSPEMNFKGKFTINPAKKPKELDLLPSDGKAPSLAIYKLEGDQLTLCLGQPRPTEFVSKQGSQHFIYTLKRMKD